MKHLVLALLAVLAACKRTGDAPTPSARKLESDAFWPDAPQPTTRGVRHRLAYNPDSINGYQMTAKFDNQVGAAATLSGDFDMTLEIRAGASPRVRDVILRHFNMSVAGKGDGQSLSLTMRLDDKQLRIEQGGQPPVTFRRGEPNPMFEFGEMDGPMATLTIRETGALEARANASHLFDKVGGADMFVTSLVLLPDLPAEEIAPGHKWTMVRAMPIAADKTVRIDVTHQFEYLGDGPCPSKASSCAHLSFTAASKRRTIQSEGMNIDVGYRFAGKVFFDLQRGDIDEARVRLDMDVSMRGQELPMGGVYTIRPLKK